MDSNTIGLLIYLGVAIVVAIASATIMRVKQSDLDRFDIGDVFISMLLGVIWPITFVGGFVYLASDFLCRKINAKKEEN